MPWTSPVGAAWYCGRRWRPWGCRARTRATGSPHGTGAPWSSDHIGRTTPKTDKWMASQQAEASVSRCAFTSFAPERSPPAAQTRAPGPDGCLLYCAALRGRARPLEARTRHGGSNSRAGKGCPRRCCLDESPSRRRPGPPSVVYPPLLTGALDSAGGRWALPPFLAFHPDSCTCLWHCVNGRFTVTLSARTFIDFAADGMT